jgi:hypothetical protein
MHNASVALLVLFASVGAARGEAGGPLLLQEPALSRT